MKPNRRTLARIHGLAAAVAVAACVHLGTAARAEAEPAIDAMILSGVDQDVTAIGRLYAGGFYGFGKLAAEAHIGFDGFLRIDSAQGVAARSVNLIDLGARYGFGGSHYAGPYVSAGGGFGLFTGKPHERKVKGDEELCSSASIPANQPQDQCTYRIDKNLSARLGFGWGFQTGSKSTVGVRLDIHYFAFSVSDFEEQPDGAPVPNQISRPQDAWSVLVGLEFMRWR